MIERQNQKILSAELSPILQGTKCLSSLRAKRSNPEAQVKDWIASSQALLAMTALLRQCEPMSAHHVSPSRMR
jgi:hypothetical protein